MFGWLKNAWIFIMLHTFTKCLNTFVKCINTFSECLKTFPKCHTTISKCLNTFLKCVCIKTMVIFKSSQALSNTRRVKSKMTKSCCSIFPSASSSWFSGLLIPRLPETFPKFTTVLEELLWSILSVMQGQPYFAKDSQTTLWLDPPKLHQPFETPENHFEHKNLASGARITPNVLPPPIRWIL